MKILVIRLSSIGDIVLTTPVIRCLQEQLNAEIHYLVKAPFASILKNNENIHAIHKLLDSRTKIVRDLRKQNFDLIIDLHKNLRSRYFIKKLGVKSISFNKLNLQKWLLTSFKINWLPKIHLVDRYFNALKSLRIKDDGKGLDYPTDNKDEDAFWAYPGLTFNEDTNYIAVAIGAAHKTKVPTKELYSGILKNLNMPVVLLGGKHDSEFGDLIVNLTGPHVVNLAGKIPLGGSAVAIKNASLLISPDTGLMHIGAAMQIPIISIWGNTVPEFGMYPFYGSNNKDLNHSIEVNNLSCRPCSKIGYEKCPKVHFNCMNLQNISIIREKIDNIITG